MTTSRMQCVTRLTTLRSALAAIDESASGVALLVDDTGLFLRTVTDGDIRRLVLSGIDLTEKLDRLPHAQSIVAEEGATLQQVGAIMDEHQIDQLPVLDAQGRPLKLIHRRDLSAPILLSTPHIGAEELNYVNEAFSTNWIAPLGPNVDLFEQELASHVGIESACALSSGTAAIHLGLSVLGVRAGDCVFVSDFTFVASVNPILYLGAEPILIDSEPDSWNMSSSALERAFAAAKAEARLPKAVVVVNLYGQSANLDPICEICSSYGVPVLEDAAESLGARYKDKASGSLGKVGCYSFNGNKIITTSGGGMLVSNDSDLIKRARYLATQARQPVAWYEHTELGYNYRLSNILAGVGRGQMKVLGDRVARRRRIGDLYREGLAGLESVNWMPEPDWSFSTRWLSCLTLEGTKETTAPEQVISVLSQASIETRRLWKPMHLQPMLKHLKLYVHHESSKQAVSAGLFERGICLPSGSNMSDEALSRVVKALRNAIN